MITKYLLTDKDLVHKVNYSDDVVQAYMNASDNLRPNWLSEDDPRVGDCTPEYLPVSIQ